MMRRINNMGPTRWDTPTDTATDREVSGQNHEREWKIRRRRRRWTFACLINTILIAVILSGIGKVDGRTIEYCTTENTGIDSTKETSTFQSHGNCYDQCKGSYAFAIVQGYDCWCSNYAPDSTGSGCTQSCPGYPSDKCGNTQAGLYAYLACPNQPSGTSTTAASSTVSSQKTSSTSSTSITSTTESSTTTSSSSTSSSSSTTSDSTSLTRTMLQADGPSITLVTTIGGTKTVMVAPTGTGGRPQTSAMKETAPKAPFFSQTGKVVGLFVGLALLIIAIVAGLLYFCYRRNLQKAAMYTRGTDSPGSGTIPAGGAGILGRSRSRSLSTLGLVTEKGGAAVNTSPTAAAVGVATPVVGTIVDQRLDPGQLFLRFENEVDSSRMSVRSLRDDADYSRRVLRLANPDE